MRRLEAISGGCHRTGHHPRRLPDVKYLLALFVVVVVGVGIATWLLSVRTERGVQCPDRVVVLRGHGGAPLECVCVDGALATCFAPGP